MSRLFIRALTLLPLALPLYLIRFKIGPLPTTFLEIILLALFVGFSVQYRWSGWKSGWKRLGSWRWPVIAWLVVTLFEVYISPSILAGFGLWRAYILEPLLVFVMLAGSIHDEKDARALRRSLFATVLFLVLWATIQFATGKGIPHPYDVAISAGRRATGPYSFPNALSLFVTPIGTWAFCLWLEDRRRLLSLVTALGALVGIALARSNGGAIAFSIVAIIALVISFARKTDRGLPRVWSGSIVGALAVASAVVFARSAWRAKLLAVLSFHEWSGKVRLVMWKETWEMLKTHWFFGAGFGGYPIMFAPFHKATYIEIFQYPHNILFNFWSETGILGVLVFVWIIVTWIRSAARNSFLVPRSLFLKLAPLLAILIHGLVDVPYFKNDLAIVFWMLIFLTTFVFKTEKTET